jgi:hypothetical protein
MQVIEKKISELVEYENNPRVNDNAVEPVAESIKSFGWKQPIVVDRNNVIVAGHTRLKAAIKLGMEKVPCIVADDLSDDEVKAYRIIDNKTGEFALWNDDLLKMELANTDYDFSSYDFSDFTADLPGVAADIKELQYSEKFGVVVDCTDEPEQRRVYELVSGAGYTPRLVSI